MTNPPLYLHVGHGKTGSSYLQSYWLKNRQNLGRLGLTYPVPETHAAQAMAGHISGGNAQMIYRPARQWRPIERAADSPLLLSSEALTEYTNKPQVLDKFQRFAKFQGLGQVKILLLIRNPIGFAVSNWQQAIKRGGSTVDISTYFENFSDLSRVRRFLELSSGFPELDIQIRNYDLLRDRLAEAVCDWLNVDPEKMTATVQQRVNRSLTAGELEFVRRLNSRLGKDASFLADALCNRLPNIAAVPIAPPLAVQQRMIDRIRPDMEAINRFVEPDQQYEVEWITPTDVSRQLSGEQVELIAQVIADKLADLAKKQKAHPATAKKPQPAATAQRGSKAYLFIGGVGRSGTSALARVVNSHPAAAIGMERYKRLLSPESISELTPRLFEPDRLLDFSDQLTNLTPENPRFTEYYADIGKKLGHASLVGDKIPPVYEYFEQIDQAFPSPKLLGIVRDISSVASSWKARAENPEDKHWPERMGAVAAVVTWNGFLHHWRYLAYRFPGQLFLVNYESFFSGNPALLERLLAFLELPPDLAINAAYESAVTIYREKLREKPLLLSEKEIRFISFNAQRNLFNALTQATD